jgi:hypothetical protein
MLRLILSAGLIILASSLSATELEFDLKHIGELPSGLGTF